MRENVKKQIRNAKKRRIRRRRFYAAVALCSILVAGIVSWKLILPGTAMSGETYCGKEEHTHSDTCYEQVLICGQEEGAGAHTHTDACYTEVRTDQLICGQEESEGHVHTDACYTNELTCGQEENAEHTHTDACYTKTLTCGQEEGAGAHTHTDACYATERKLTCGQEEGAGHTHTDACYKTELTCGKEEHKHTSECYSNPDAVETEDQWKAAFKNYKLTGEWGKDTAAVAKSQVGYKESTENYKVNEDKSTDGYTRYADWAGDDIYGDWNTDFAAFCLNYGGVPADKFPVNADDLNVWITAMNDSGYYGDPDSTEPQPGDLIVLKKADQDNKQSVGIVSEVKTDKNGNVITVKVIEGDCDDAVKENTYAADSSEIVGYGLVNKAYEDTVGSGEETSDKADENVMAESASRSIAPKKAAPMRAANGDGHNLMDHLTNVLTQKLQGNTWVSTTDFTEGDTIRVLLSYSLPANTVGENNKVVYYQVPDGVSLAKEESGIVYDGDTPVGTYTISQNGYIEITFDDHFADDKAFTGSVQFEGTVHKSDDGENRYIDFGANGTITVTPTTPPTDVSVRKEGKYEEGKLYYTLIVSTTQGTGEMITINDYLGGSTSAQYDRGSFVITGPDNNQLNKDTYTLSIKDGSSSSQNFELTLPGLKAGKQYKIEYTVTPGNTTNITGYSNVTNSVQTSTDGHGGGTGWSDITIQQAIISKTGNYDSTAGVIRWTITLNSGDKDLGGFQLEDILQSNNDIKIGDAENIILTDPQGKTIKLDDLSYIFLNNSKGTYTITYETKVTGLNPGDEAAVTNDAKITKEDEEYEHGTTVYLKGKDYGLDKAFEAPEQSSDTTGTYRWSSEISVPAGISEEALSFITYTDTLDPLKWTDENGEEQSVSDSHYITGKQLAELKISYNNGELSRGENDDYVIYDKAGEVITDFSESAKYDGFQIKFNLSAISKLSGQNVRLIYRTTVDYTTLTERINYTIRNTGAIPGHSDDATTQYRKQGKIEKQAKTSVSSGGFTDAEFTVDYDTFDGVIHYRLLIDTTGAEGDIKVTDILPAGATLIENDDKPKMRFYESAYYEYDEIGWHDIAGNYYTYKASENLLYSKAEESDGSAILTFTIKDGYNNNGKNHILAIYYDVNIAKGEGSVWDSDPALDEHSYTNTVSLKDGESVSHTVTVERNVPDLKKTGAQLDESGQMIEPEQPDQTGTSSNEVRYSNKVRYYVVINQGGKDLDPAKESLELIDTLSNINGLADISLNINDVKLYYFNANMPNNCGTEVNDALYSYVYDRDNQKITFSVPDSMAMVLVYDYTIDLGNSKVTTISNTVSLTGIGESEDSTDVTLHETSSGATASKRTLTIYKVDATDYGTHLAGAEFLLEMYNPDKEAWTDKGTDGEKVTFTTAADGKFELNRDASELWPNFNFQEQTLYRLSEITAPKGYEKDSSYHYFVWTQPGQTAAGCKESMGEKLTNSGADIDDIMFIDAASTAIYIPNEPTDITVHKVWTDKEGMESEAPQESIEVQLKQHTLVSDACTVTLTSQGNDGSNPPITKTIQVKKGTIMKISFVQANENMTIDVDGVPNKIYGTETFETKQIDKNVTIVISSSGSWVYKWEAINLNYSVPDQPTAGETENYGASKFLNASNGWSCTWENLPKYDTDTNNTYYYTVEEVNPPAGYSVIYSSNNSGIQAGEITITNQANGYILPETGGIGTKVYIAGGTILMMSSCLLGGYRMRRKRERRRR